jgi:hypothetical protein
MIFRVGNVKKKLKNEKTKKWGYFFPYCFFINVSSIFKTYYFILKIFSSIFKTYSFIFNIIKKEINI